MAVPASTTSAAHRHSHLASRTCRAVRISIPVQDSLPLTDVADKPAPGPLEPARTELANGARAEVHLGWLTGPPRYSGGLLRSAPDRTDLRASGCKRRAIRAAQIGTARVLFIPPVSLSVMLEWCRGRSEQPDPAAPQRPGPQPPLLPRCPRPGRLPAVRPAGRPRAGVLPRPGAARG